MTDLLYIILVIILNSMFFFTFGFIAGYKIIERKTANPQVSKREPVATIPAKQLDGTKPDVINHEGVGIVYRPSVEELNKMEEDQNTKDAKEAIAEELRKEREPVV